MSDDSCQSATHIRERLAGRHILVTGASGFLAKVFVEKLLRCVETIGGIHLLIRPRPGRMTAQQRVEREVLGSCAFDRARATLGDGFAQMCAKKVHVVAGDLTRERIGLDEESYGRLAETVTLVVNSAATVTFDERMDLAVDLNALGPQRLLRFVKECGNVPFLHVSTCYVCGARNGVVIEDMSAPEQARHTLPRLEGADGFDLDKLVKSMRTEAEELRKRHGVDTEECRRRLIDAGMERARAHGWNDTYTFTKWIGEQFLSRDHGAVPLVIFRPAIIEGSFEEPLPGWIDGLRMADPLIVAYGRGKLDEFPGRADIAIDLIPVDFVANAMIAALPLDVSADEPLVYHCASSGRNPLLIRDMCDSVRRAFLKRPMQGDNGRPVLPPPLKLTDKDVFTRRWKGRQRRVLKLQSLLERVRVARRQVRKLAGISRQIEQLLYFTKIYVPYTHLECRFADARLREAAEKLHADDRREFPFDAADIDWDDYIVNRHVPGVRSFVLRTGAEPSGRIAAVGDLGASGAALGFDALGDATIFEAFQRSAERSANRPALKIRRGNRWISYSYEEALRATGAIAQRFAERGLGVGDRVAICGENCPEWGLTYLAAVRAGLTAVPLDPQLPPKDVWFAARFADARLVCAGDKKLASLVAERGAGDAEVIAMAQPFVPPPGASRDPTPDAVAIPTTAIASILFTSGTTVAPKAVPLTHRNFLANAAALLQVHPVYERDEFLSVLPLYHAFEFTGGFLIPLICGASVTYVEQLKGAEIRSAMQATGTTAMLVVPRLLRMFHDAIAANVASAGLLRRLLFRAAAAVSRLTGGRLGRRLFGAVHRGFGGRVRIMVSGGSRLDPDLFEAFRIMGFPVYEGYGLTETSPVLSVNPPYASRAGSVGIVLANVEVDIRNQNLEGIGEVWAHGPSVMSGYLHNVEATAEVLENGWFRTGDLGRVDGDGYLYLTGRSTDLIVTGAGKNVYPDEVEQRYAELPHMREICVFGMPSKDGLGDVVHAVIVLNNDQATGLDRSSIEREVRLAAEALSESVPPHQRIAVLHFWERELPKTSTLKAKRGRIREMVRAESALADKAVHTDDSGSEGVPSTDETAPARPGTAGYSAVCEILASHSRSAPDAIRPNMHLLLDLGIDSIGRIGVLGEIEVRFRTWISDEHAAKVARVCDLLSIVGDREPSAARAATPDFWKRRLAGDTASAAGGNGRIAAPLLPVRWLVRGSVGVFMNTYVRVRVRGRENILARGAFILAPNHSSHLDMPSVLTAVGGRRRVWVAGAEDYFFNTRLRRFLFGSVLDTIAFDRRSDGLSGLRRCGDVLTRGGGLLMFPEGTRSATGRLQPFKIGVAVLAVECGVPIIPAHIHHAFDLFRKGQLLVRPGVVTVTFGRPIYPPDECEIRDQYEAFRALAVRVESAVGALAGEARV